MKNGVLIYPPHLRNRFNIGDYVQSIAARQFLPRVDEYVDRERMDSPRTEDIALIANGWYMHEPTHWPPSDKIHPLFVALHLNKLAEKELLSPENIEYFKRHQPIGCRDHYTEENLKKLGVDAYFSGCLTLTLGETYKRDEVGDEIYITDLNAHLPNTPGFALKCLKNLVFKGGLLRKIRDRQKESGVATSLKSVAALYTTYSPIFDDEVFLKANYVEQMLEDTFESEDAKFAYADELLNKYRKARFVVTTRIHCALPCLAMGVPVLFLYDKNNSWVNNCRLDGLVQLFNTIEIEGNKVSCEVPGKIGLKGGFENKEAYKPLAADLVSRAREFVKTVNAEGGDPKKD